MLRRLLAGIAMVLTCATVVAQSSVNYTFSHFAGPQSGPGSADGTGSAAQFAYPAGVAVDAGGNVYVADRYNHTIRKVTSSGAVTTIAGQPGTYGYADANGSAARFFEPSGVAVDGAGNIFVADTVNRRIRKITPAGDVSTLAGSSNYNVVDGTGTAAGFSWPRALVIDAAGTLYVSDNYTIRKVTQAGVVTTFAGTAGASGNADGNGSSARFNFDFPGLAFDSASNLYVADTSNFVIRKIAPNGDVSTFAGTAGSEGCVDAKGTAARFSRIVGMGIDSAGNLYVADATGNLRMRKVSSAGDVATFAGTGGWGNNDGSGSAAQFDDLTQGGMAVDSSGTVYFTDRHRLRKISPAGAVTTVAGQPTLASAIVDATGLAARFNWPLALVTDSAGNIYLTDTNNHAIRKITPDGVVTTLAGPGFGSADGTGSAAQFKWPNGITIDAQGNLYVVDSGNNTIRKITQAGVVTTIAGTAGVTGSADGTAAAAQFHFAYWQQGLAVDANGTLYVSDGWNYTIRQITSAGVVTTLAGQAGSWGRTDGTGSAARFARPAGLTLSGSTLFVADDTGIRSIASGGVVTTLAGHAGWSGVTDGIGAQAVFHYPVGLVLGPDGTLIVTDQFSIRRVTMGGLVTRIAGAYDRYGTIDGAAATALFNRPQGVAIDGAGSLYIGDADSHTVRKATLTACTPADTTITAPSFICGSGTGTASVPDAGTGAEYFWSITGGTISGSTTARSISFTPTSGSASVTLTVSITNASFCTASSTKTIAVNAPPSATMTFTPTGAVCAGSSVTVSVPDAGTGATYSWRVVPPIAFTGNGTSSITFAAPETISAYVTVTNSSGCSASSSGSVAMDATISIDRNVFPAEGGSGTVTLFTSCSWSAVSGGSWLTLSGATSGTGNGTVTFTVAPNTASTPRSTLLSVAGARWSVDQAGTGLRDTSTYAVRHLAGNVNGKGYADGTGTAARFAYPDSLVIDSNGNIFVVDNGNSTIRKITPSGTVSTFAGAAGLTGSADGTGANARFWSPEGIAIDAADNLYVADTSASTIRKITPAGAVTTIAGMPLLRGNVDGTGNAARFSSPYALTVDGSGTIYVADYGASTIRQITSSGVVTTLAGTAFQRGSTDGTGTAALFDHPTSIVIDSKGNLFVGDYSAFTVRKIAPGGVVTTFAGQAYTSGTQEGVGSAARFQSPAGLTIDASDNLYLVDAWVERIAKITPTATVTNVLMCGNGSTDGPLSQAQFDFDVPNGLAFARSGELFISDGNNHTIRRITTSGSVTTFAGSAWNYGYADGFGSSAMFLNPSGVAVDAAGNVWVADRSNAVIRKVTSGGGVSTFAGQARTVGSADGSLTTARFNSPWSVAVDAAGALYVSDYGSHTIRKIAGGSVTTLAGAAGQRGTADGTSGAARFNYPRGIAVDAAGTVYVADSLNHTIRKITSAGVVTTLAGHPGVLGWADGVGTAALFNTPTSVAVDGAGNVYVADSFNYVLRKVAPDGTVSTIAGTPSRAGTADGNGSAARFQWPLGVTIDSSGTLFVTDSYVIRKVSSAGDVSTILGLPHAAGNVDGAGSAARLDTSWGIAVDGSGSLYIADTSSQSIRVASAGIVPPKGDANGDGALTAVDVFYLINVLFQNGGAPVGSCDVNGDGKVDVRDLFFLINYVFANGPAPQSIAPGASAMSHDAPLTGAPGSGLAIGVARVHGTKVTLPIVVRGTADADALSFRIRSSSPLRNATVHRGSAFAGLTAVLETAPRSADSIGYVLALGGQAVHLTDGAVVAELEIEIAAGGSAVLSFDRTTTALGLHGVTAIAAEGGLEVVGTAVDASAMRERSMRP